MLNNIVDIIDIIETRVCAREKKKKKETEKCGICCFKQRYVFLHVSLLFYCFRIFYYVFFGFVDFLLFLWYNMFKTNDIEKGVLNVK